MNPGDAGEPPSPAVDVAGRESRRGRLEFPAPKRLPLGPLMDFGYENEVLFPVFVGCDAGGEAWSYGVCTRMWTWLVCREVCIPGKAELELSRKVEAGEEAAATSVEPDATIWKRLGNALPVPLPANDHVKLQSTATGFRLTVVTGRRETEALFFPEDPIVLSNPAPQKLTPTATGFTLDLTKDSTLVRPPATLSGLIELSGGRVYQVSPPTGSPVAALANALENASAAAQQAATEQGAAERAAGAAAHAANSPGLLGAIALAFLGGLLLNLMPCVFPVLFIKGLALVQSGNEERHKLRNDPVPPGTHRPHGRPLSLRQVPHHEGQFQRRPP